MADGDAGRTSIIVFLIHLLARGVGFLGLVYFARVLPQSELGIYFLFFLIVQMSSMVSNMGLSTAIVQRVSASDRPEAIYTAAITAIGALTLVAGACFVVFRGPIGAYVGADVPLLLTLAVGGWLLADIHKGTIQGEDRVITSNLLQIGEDVVRVGVGAALITAGLGAEGLMYGVIVGFAVTALAGVVVTDLGVSRPTRGDFESLFAITRYTMFFGPANFVYFWFDTFMIGLLLTREGVSAYEVAWQTVRVLVIPTNAIGQTIFPKVSRLETEGAREEIERILAGAILFSLTIPLPGVVGLAVLGPEVLALVYRPAYADAALPLVALGIYMLVESVYRVGSQCLTGMDRARIPFRSRMVGVALAIGLNVVLIPEYGLIGAAIATVAAKAADALLLWIPLWRLLHVDLPWRSVLWQAASAGLMGLALVGATGQVAVTSLPVLFALVAGGAGLYWALVLLDPEIRTALLQYVPVLPERL